MQIDHCYNNIWKEYFIRVYWLVNLFPFLLCFLIIFTHHRIDKSLIASPFQREFMSKASCYMIIKYFIVDSSS